MEALSLIKVMNQDFVCLDCFDGQNFIRWQQKMFFLTTLKFAYNLYPWGWFWGYYGAHSKRRWKVEGEAEEAKGG
jgi:hypothetical protein